MSFDKTQRVVFLSVILGIPLVCLVGLIDLWLSGSLTRLTGIPAALLFLTALAFIVRGWVVRYFNRDSDSRKHL